MVRRGWITRDQFSSLFSGPQRPTPEETMLLGLGDGEIPPDADGEDWGLTVSDEDDKTDLTPEVEWARPDLTEEKVPPEPETGEAVPVLSGAASTAQLEWDMLVPPVAGGKEARRRESDADKLLRQWLGWAGKGLLMGTLLLGCLLAGVRFFGASSTVPPGARQESRSAQAKTRVLTAKRAVSRPQIPTEKTDKVPINNVVGTVRPPEPLRPPAGAGNAKDETVRGVERIKDVEEPRRVHIVYFREGNREWTERYFLDKNGKVISDDVQREDLPSGTGQNAQPAASVAGPVAAPQVRFPAQAVPQQGPMPLDSFTFEQMVRQNQERVRQQIMQAQQQMMQRHREVIQQHLLQIMRVRR
jgi:hypothetical protein